MQVLNTAHANKIKLDHPKLKENCVNTTIDLGLSISAHASFQNSIKPLITINNR